MNQSIVQRTKHTPWNRGKLSGQKRPLKLQDIWAIRIRHLGVDVDGAYVIIKKTIAWTALARTLFLCPARSDHKLAIRKKGVEYEKSF